LKILMKMNTVYTIQTCFLVSLINLKVVYGKEIYNFLRRKLKLINNNLNK
jgi:hypothetical protein